MAGAAIDDVLKVLAEQGPLTGAQLHEAVGGEIFALWKACTTADALLLKTVGRRYVRLDRTIEGFARLSPSILREFMTYTIVGLASDADAVDEAARRLQARITVISRNKHRLATRIVQEAFGPLVRAGRANLDAFCALVAGDIVYGMSHDVARRETSTQSVVEGSDLDIIVLVRDADAAALMPVLDEALLGRKWLYLRNPAFREEVDYVIKPMARLADQASFDSFTTMVACKVFDEAELIYGSAAVYEEGLALLRDNDVPGRLRALEALATTNREARRQRLLALPDDRLPGPEEVTFYTNEEAAEFEH
ncbi:hypothetical protein [Propioniciclava tarda]|uniref:Nucleotidyltransferase domain-containing protein n=1 Tax=Propioniciclava tarda TaxID=433330 RepID=A0A4Q9KNM3_PROTD|nr:hypothetical protein [Propioniciclava tarda]TBT95590.1 hypothetical protein ET996_03820 [Propioniciclava tarda]SMO48224.1 hypothetical protein SAMN06266982_103185 [Propioniciclava tarda]